MCRMAAETDCQGFKDEFFIQDCIHSFVVSYPSAAAEAS